MNSAKLEVNLTAETEPPLTETRTEPTPTENQVEINQEIQSNCRGYLVDPITKLHLCNACAYHKHRNESKPWLKVKE